MFTPLPPSEGVPTPGAAPSTVAHPTEPCLVVIFGASGDLTKRKLLPSLFNLRMDGHLNENFAVVGMARSAFSDEEFQAKTREALEKYGTRPNPDAVAVNEFCKRAYYFQGNYDDVQNFDELAAKLEEVNKRHGLGGRYLFYLAIPPSSFDDVVANLGASGLSQEEGGAWRRVIIEKPFGHDLESAKELGAKVSAVFREQQVFRIDHYLGKETVQNILVFRFGNGLFEPIWNRRYIDHVQITVAESLGVEGRGGYYEQSGALRDVMQNHMFALLTLICMEPPVSLVGESVRNEKIKVLESIRPMSEEEIARDTVRGQYGPGEGEDGAPVAGYREEPDVAPDSDTDTYAAVKLEIDNWRWAGVPFYLRTGKRLATRATEIVIVFRSAPLTLYGESGPTRVGPNRILMHIQPCEGITVYVRAKVPGPALATKGVALDFNYADMGIEAKTTGYETLLYDCMKGDATLFHRTDMVEAAWRIATPILQRWEQTPGADLPNYAAGSWGPAAADELLARDAREWKNPTGTCAV